MSQAIINLVETVTNRQRRYTMPGMSASKIQRGDSGPMLFEGKLWSNRAVYSFRVFTLTLVLVILGLAARAQEPELGKKLQGFDSYIAQVLKDWNTPGIGVGIVVRDQLVFAKGYGYRDYQKKLPFTPTTLCQIASNSKLFTAVAAGMLVEEGKLSWDKPVRESVPTIQFYNDQLNNNVTLRDMLSHRTGVTRHDLIWFKSAFKRKDLFEKLKYLEPRQPMRETFLYNNLMFSAVGYIIELKSGKTWEEFVRERILRPLDMNSTTYTISEMVKHPDHGVPFKEKRDSFELYKIPYYEDTEGVAPAGALISNLEEMSHWLIALYNVVSYDVYERLLGMDQTPWSQRRLEQRLANKKAGTEARAKAGADRVPNTKPSHALTDYAAEYENPAYGILKIGLKDNQLQFGFHEFRFPMSHFHYDRFDTPEDDQYGKFSVNFRTNPQGDIDNAVISLDEAEAVFTRRPETLDPKLLEKLAGVYLTPARVKFQVLYQPGAGLSLVFPGAPPLKLSPVKGLQFRTPQFSDTIYEFVMENGQVKALKERDPSGEYSFSRQ